MRVAVVGLPRTGTSAIAGMLRILGFEIVEGSECPSCEHEDLRSPMSREGAVQVIKKLHDLPDGFLWKDPSVGEYADMVPWNLFKVVRIHRLEQDTIDAEVRRVPRGHPAPAERNRRWAASIGEHVIADVNISFELMKISPDGVLDLITIGLGLPRATASQRLAVDRFIQREPGYRCPLPRSCTVH